MAEVKPRLVRTALDGRIAVYVWDSMNAGDTIVPLEAAGDHVDKTVWFLSGGAFGGSLAFEGAPMPSTETQLFATLKEPDGTPISGIAANAARTCLQGAYAVRPSVGAGVSAVSCWLYVHRT
jgi:hypothetical protein